MVSKTESLVSKIPPALRMRVRLIILGINPGTIPKYANISELTARRAARGDATRPTDPRRAASVAIMSQGIDAQLEERCVGAAALLRKEGHKTPEIQALLMNTVRPILEHARDLGKKFRAPSIFPDDPIQESLDDPSALGDYLAGVDGAALESETGS